MPQIKIIEAGEGRPDEDDFEETRTFSAPSGWSAIFHDPNEFHMGAYAWSFRLEHNGRDVTPLILRMPGKGGNFNCPKNYQPWSYDCARMLLASWKSGCFLFEISRSRSSNLELEGLIAAFGSAVVPRFLVTTVNSNYLLGEYGEVINKFIFRKPLHGYADLGWFDPAQQFFGLEPLGRGKAQFTFYSAESAIVLSTLDFNPSDVFPYDELKYGVLNRDAFALVVSNAVQCVASLLDVWSKFRFDQSTGIFKASVYRPTGEIFQNGGRSLCRVKEHWVKAEIVQ